MSENAPQMSENAPQYVSCKQSIRVAMVTNNRDYVFLVSKGKGKVGVECEMCSGGKGLEKLSSGSYRKL